MAKNILGAVAGLATWFIVATWYHLTFLLSLVPLTYAGSRLVGRMNS